VKIDFSGEYIVAIQGKNGMKKISKLVVK